MRNAAALAILLAVSSQASVAFGDDSKPSVKREVPDYDGRGPPDAPNGIVWVPRILLSPVYVLTEYGIRRPLSLAVPAVERADLPRKVYDFFVFGEDHKAGILPVAFVAFPFQPSFGAYAFWNDSFYVKDSTLRVHYEMWPPDWFSAAIDERIVFAGRHSLQLHAFGMRRPDRVFYGIGSSTPQSNQSRFTEARFDTSAMLELGFGKTSHIDTKLGMRKVSTSHGDMNPDPSIEQASAMGWFPIPYGFNTSYTVGYAHLGATFDTREHQLQDSGLRAELRAENATDTRTGASWVRYGASATGAIDLTGHHRVLSLSVAALFSDPLNNAQIPFTELVTIGGDQLMRGFFPGRLVDRSGAVMTLRYDWPIAPWLGGSLQTAVGNVFGEHLTSFRPELLRLSMVVGFSFRGAEPPIDMVLGFATDTFERGGAVDAVRFSLGVPYDFF